MNFILSRNSSTATDKTDCHIIPIFTDKENKNTLLEKSGEHLNTASSGVIRAILDEGDFKGTVGSTMLLHNIGSSRVLLMGCGDQSQFDIKQLNSAVKSTAKALKSTAIKNMTYHLVNFTESLSINKDQAITQTIIAFSDALYELLDYKSKKESKDNLEEFTFACLDGFDDSNAIALKNGIAIAEGMKISRDLANHPGNICTPTFVAETAQTVADDYQNIEIEVLEESDMEALGMGSFLSVSKGSDEPGKMIILQYTGAQDKQQAPVALVGKGVTFDTGGISLKPGASMDEMKFDMSGAAAMLGTLKACAAMQLDINLVVVLAAAENMPSARASKPGDIVTSMQGTTIEVLNTDAEGRLVLCDALTYVGKFKPAIVIDAATLTGACIIALGHHISAVLSNNDTLANELLEAGTTINDQAWRLPMNDDYKKQLKSAFADLGNIGGRAAGTITAACFLSEFTKDYHWAHLDIAGTAWTGKNSTGRPVPLLSQYLINRSKQSL